MIEIVADRQVNAKFFDNGDGTLTGIVPGLLHVPSDYAAWKRGEPVSFTDIDNTWESDGAGGWRLKSGWFTVVFDAERFGVTVTWINGTVETWRLAELATVTWTRSIAMSVVARGSRLEFRDIAPDLDIVIEAKKHARSIGFEIFKIIKSPIASHDLGWDVEWRDAGGENHSRQFTSQGFDAVNRRLTFDHVIGTEGDRPLGRRGRTAREQITGFVRLAPPGTTGRLGRLIEPADIAYPLTVDTESVVTTGTTLAKPSDWNNADNKIECVGAGGGGAGGGEVAATNCGGGGGGGGGEYRAETNVTWGADPETIQIGANGAAGADNANGGNGTNTFYRSTAFLNAIGGNGGSTSTSSTGGSGGTGGTGGTGTTGFAGGAGAAGGNGLAGDDGSGGGGGGGGAAGDTAAGNAGTAGGNATAGEEGGTGGAGGDGNGSDTGRGTGGAGTALNVPDTAGENGGVGGAGTDLGEGGAGTGGGGGAGNGAGGESGTSGVGGAAGNYGGGGGAGGGCTETTTTAGGAGGAGTAGVIILTWTPGGGGGAEVLSFNLAMTGVGR